MSFQKQIKKSSRDSLGESDICSDKGDFVTLWEGEVYETSGNV